MRSYVHTQTTQYVYTHTYIWYCVQNSLQQVVTVSQVFMYMYSMWIHFTKYSTYKHACFVKGVVKWLAIMSLWHITYKPWLQSYIKNMSLVTTYASLFSQHMCKQMQKNVTNLWTRPCSDSYQCHPLFSISHWCSNSSSSTNGYESDVPLQHSHQWGALEYWQHQLHHRHNSRGAVNMLE